MGAFFVLLYVFLFSFISFRSKHFRTTKCHIQIGFNADRLDACRWKWGREIETEVNDSEWKSKKKSESFEPFIWCVHLFMPRISRQMCLTIAMVCFVWKIACIFCAQPELHWIVHVRVIFIYMICSMRLYTHLCACFVSFLSLSFWSKCILVCGARDSFSTVLAKRCYCIPSVEMKKKENTEQEHRLRRKREFVSRQCDVK